jgi:tetrapyrrole methylase family protein/MazG family protein
MDSKNRTAAAFERLYNTLKQLRGENGCPWDKEQTPQSLRRNLIEEAYELIDAVNAGDSANVKEELGDVYLVLTMMASIYEEEGQFSVAEALEAINTKIISRHPHVFGDASAATAEESMTIWQQQKLREGRTAATYLGRAGRGLPPLERGYEIEKKLAKAGYHFATPHDCFAKIEEELAELKDEVALNDREKMLDELGDVLLTVVSLAGHLQLDPSEALNRANNKVVKRFDFVEKELKAQNLPLERAYLKQMEAAWQRAKKFFP